MRNLFAFIILFSSLAGIACKQQTDETTNQEESTAKGNEFKIDVNLSEVKWQAFKPLGAHEGIVPIQEGNVIVEKGAITGGKVVLDMRNLLVTDLEGEDKQNLQDHLRGNKPGKEDDFFNTSKYPTATFVVTNATPLNGDPEATHMIEGQLTMRDITKPVSFKAKVDLGAVDAIKITVPPFNIDRTEWGVKFRSKKFFDDLKDDFVNDEIKLQMVIAAIR